MIRNNLSTRPFYNETAVRLWLGVFAVVVAAMTIFNVQRLIHYSRSDTELATQASRDEQLAVEKQAEATRLRGSVDTTQIETASLEAREANELIDRRTFSWTELLNRLEATQPADVRITSLRRSLDQERGNLLTITVVARNVADVNQFMENMAGTGVFTDFLATEETVDPDTNQLQVVLKGAYRPTAGAAVAPTPEKAATQ